MPLQIVWTIKAQTEIIAIFQYWNDRTKSNRFSVKLNELMKKN